MKISEDELSEIVDREVGAELIRQTFKHPTVKLFLRGVRLSGQPFAVTDGNGTCTVLPHGLCDNAESQDE